MAEGDKPEDDDDKTVFLPPGRKGENPAQDDASQDVPGDEDDDDEKTVFVPRQTPSQTETTESGDTEAEADSGADSGADFPEFTDMHESTPAPAPPPSATPPPPVSNRSIEASSPPPDPSAFPSGPDMGAAPIQPIAIGDYVNVFRIERFIAKGGMGEVYEAVNPHPPFESVAVKLMLSDLANDKNALEMFYKEASALGRVHHQAIVQYRIASQSPNGQPYLITEFVPGPSLQELLGKLTLDELQLRDLTKRLSKGLGAAHKEDVVHRDIAPDNVLLAEGNPQRPKIIDFGIVKDTHENGKTIIGDGFAGKLRYVAPEQLGEYNFNVGPWTDIYSLALTMLAVASGKHADMGSSLSDAVRKRLGVPDLSAIPEAMRPAFEAALQPDPAKRPQTMEAFAKLLDEGAASTASDTSAEAQGGASFAPLSGSQSGESSKKEPKTATITGLLGALDETKKKLIYGGIGGFVLLAALVGILIVATSPDEIEEPVIDDSAPEPIAQEAPKPPIEQVAQQAAAGVQCAWLTFEGSTGNAVRFSGGAARQGTVVRNLQAAFAANGYPNVTIDTSQVVEFGQNLCPMVSALSSVRRETPIMSSPRASYELELQEGIFSDGLQGIVTREALIAKPIINVSGLRPEDEILLLIIEDQKAVLASANREDTKAIVEGYKGEYSEVGFNVTLQIDDTGNKALILLSGPNSGFPGDAIGAQGEALTIEVTPEWGRRFEREARAAGWKADIVWFSIVDKVKP
jgi:eukaryotic-like serine/threonine-protein kinase